MHYSFIDVFSVVQLGTRVNEEVPSWLQGFKICQDHCLYVGENNPARILEHCMW